MYTTRPFARSSLTPDLKQKNQILIKGSRKHIMYQGQQWKPYPRAQTRPGPVCPQNRLPQKHPLHIKTGATYLPWPTSPVRLPPHSHALFPTQTTWLSSSSSAAFPLEVISLLLSSIVKSKPQGPSEPNRVKADRLPLKSLPSHHISKRKGSLESLRLRNKHTSGKTQSLSTQTRWTSTEHGRLGHIHLQKIIRVLTRGHQTHSNNYMPRDQQQEGLEWRLCSLHHMGPFLIALILKFSHPHRKGKELWRLF